MNIFKKDKKQLSLFITAGFPELNSLNEQLVQLEKHEIDFVEVGIPFSDPLADGPVIQETSSISISKGMNMELLFDQLKQRTSTIPLVLMGYMNPILKYGLERFLLECVACKIQSVILPDMSVEIYERFYQNEFESAGIYPSFLITPATSTERIQKIADLCSNSFVYLVSSNATTGGSSPISQNAQRYLEIKSICGDTPVFIGFGIRTRSDVEQVQKVVDGVIIGSAFLEAIMNKEGQSFLKIFKKPSISTTQVNISKQSF